MTISDHNQPALLPPPESPWPRVTTPPEPLFSIAGATASTLQWKAEAFQLVNWGGFEGRVRFDFHSGATLISGASGTGKSTLLDAYIALMMPSDTPFNGASNDAVAGRARSAEQRNLLSYLRGQTDTTADDHGRERPKVLRGAGRPTWGAVAMTFIDDHGRRFTALRIYHVSSRATQAGDITMRMATYEGHLDLADLAEHASSLFAPKSLKTAFPGLLTHDSYASFAARLHTRLGIGANGDGAKALRLLVRIQSGHQIRTVDELYKDMVLERPATYEAADRAIGHFDDLEDAHAAMRKEQQKAELLGPITQKHADITAAQATIEQIDTFGVTAAGDTPIVLWRLRREAALLDSVITANQEKQKTNGIDLTSAIEREQSLEGELVATVAAHQDAGGGELENLAQQAMQQRQRRDERLARRAALTERTVELAVPLDDRDTFAQLQATAAAFLATGDTAEKALRDRREELRGLEFPLLENRRKLTEERASLAGRAGRVPKHLDDLRHDVARASRIQASELPFLAELIDIAPDQGRWRTAVETVLGASARLLLVPRDRLEMFSAAIDPLRLRGRLTFEGVPLGLDGHADTNPDRIAGKLVFKPSSFTGWVQRHVSDPARNALCLEDPDQLGGPGYRVTIAGQTRLGTRGTHGRNEQPNIIGFSNEDTLADIDRELRDIEANLDTIDHQRQTIDSEWTTLNARRSAYEAIRAVTWDDIDVASVEAAIDKLDRARQAILDADDNLQQLQGRIDQLKEELEGARARRFELKQKETNLRLQASSLNTQHTGVQGDLHRINLEKRVVLTDEQTAALDRHFTAAVAPADPSDLDQFPTNLSRLRQRLSATAQSADTQLRNAEAELERIFAAYQLKFEDPNLGRTAASYQDYATILDSILSTGLHERQQEWRKRLMKWSGEDLVPLAGAMESSIEDIEERLEPINGILRGLPFGANRDRLRIKLRRLTPDAVVQFRRQLRVLSSGATRELPEHQMEQRFHDLQQFMGRIRRRNDPRAVADLSDRDRLLDVRRHVDITAERYDTTGQLLSTHSSLGGKSGGESQELVAFIVGAALRFRLGDELRERPRFAPVFLDEGFVKSDAEFAGRAVQAWKGLGFQLIIGAPLDKVTALEPHMDELLAITKNTSTHYSFVSRISDATHHPVSSPSAIPNARPP
ncbi:SbcC/MukB-like Walker B domain-containing protein [Micromonospora sp. 4G55]|uniref:ATP-binding protein n=1 Tax=Micromonospora sp. 4G55 TaxID=2806102 RepID=UPI001A59EBB4|nr:SbcC/MukB-like Walker B domain-containing protein [Micromonospora sp. 4G55]MBM0255557.1 AAA family ATPase [Micromonospora sp. 4G55]